VKLAITGATGFVGGHLLDRAQAEGHEVRALTRRPQPPRPGVTWISGSLETPDALAELVRGADAVVHAAAAVNAPDAAGFEDANVRGTASLLAALAPGQRLVHVSSLAAREPALSNYGRSKAGAEAAVAASAAGWTIVRPPAVYGPGDLEMLEIFRAAARARIIPLPPRGRASMLHARDLADLLLRLCGGASDSRILEPDDGHPLSHPELARAVGRALGHRVLPLPVSAALLRAGARLDRRLRLFGGKLTMDRVGYLLHPDWVSAPARAVPESFWRPSIDQATGLAETAEWYRAHRLL
jgi:nucleoside-diphosphate-sugar epimerase